MHNKLLNVRSHSFLFRLYISQEWIKQVREIQSEVLFDEIRMVITYRYHLHCQKQIRNKKVFAQFIANEA